MTLGERGLALGAEAYRNGVPVGRGRLERSPEGPIAGTGATVGAHASVVESRALLTFTEVFDPGLAAELQLLADDVLDHRVRDAPGGRAFGVLVELRLDDGTRGSASLGGPDDARGNPVGTPFRARFWPAPPPGR